LVALILTGLIRVEIIAALELLLGISQTLSQPARQCLVPGLVPRSELPAAVALNSLTFNLARCVGPAVSGVMIAAFGVVPSIACNCVAYLYASLTLPMLKLAPEYRRGHKSNHSVWHDAADGLRYVVRNGGMGPIFLYAASIGILLRSVPEMLPPFVAQLFSRGAEGLAVLASTMGLAALAGGLLVALRARLEGLSRIALGAGLLLNLATAGFVATHSFTVGVICMGLMGAATTIHGISIQTLLQSACAPGMVGRVLSLWGMVVRAGPAMGALIYGAASEFVGLQVPVVAGCLLGCLAFLWAWSRLPAIEGALEKIA
jgi:predicted MFS family arabinose efflux permease